ncbi:MAG TPA: glutathione S-transferase C-terminal domain-containing protein [Jatrophihabitans sp.]|jgi:putative glutathione S-transferase
MAEFTRTPSHFADRITASGDDGWPVEAGRYRLVISRACPWASRAAITRRLMGLDTAISQGVADPVQEQIDGGYQWVFTAETGSPDDRDPVLGIHAIQQAYQAREASYPGGESVPIIVDIPTGVLVTNDYPQITLDLATQWGELQRHGAPELYPDKFRDEIDELNEQIYTDVNNGVYAAGFAHSQQRYDEAMTAVFARLDMLEQRLAGQRFLAGDTITEADIRLFVTLVRFDAVYHGHFKCNIAKLIEFPALWGYARDLFQTPGFGDTVDLDHIRRHYYYVHDAINPTRVVARGPDPAQWRTPHHRDQLGGRPFGDGTAPPPALPEDRVAHPVL